MSQFTQNELRVMADNCEARIRTAIEGTEFFTNPYKYIILDNFLDSKLAELCMDSFPNFEDPCWEHANDIDIEVKYRTNWKSEFDIQLNIVEAVRILNSAPVLLAMSERIGIPKIVPDPYFTGGGLNVTIRGGLLDVHVDGNYHDATGLNRRLNTILYLNPGWEPSWGGEFGVYDKTGMECVKRIPPLFNRLVIFDSHDFSYHGLPDPINFPESVTRKSIIPYYYTKEPRPDSQVATQDPHSALWVKRDFKDNRGNKTRAFK
jgi:Rps23 Pro-64 3,4-dihydroxylase Tpa1-like proline 4-hydroxylase